MRLGDSGESANAADGNPNFWPEVATVLVISGYVSLLAISLTDYRVTIDSGFHVSLGRAFADNGSAWWDHSSFGPAGRPNLQAPLLHIGIAILGRALGGHPDSYVLANSILALVQWTSAVATVYFFSRLLGGSWAAFFAVLLFAGAGFSSGSFAVGIPSGWLFIFIPWAIYFFLERRLAISAFLTTVAIYSHVGGFLTAPVGLLVAAFLARRWRGLVVVGCTVFLLTLPFSIHLLRFHNWYQRGGNDSVLLIDPMLDLLAITATVFVLQNPKENQLLVAWTCAPAAWLFQDPARFVVQSSLAGSVAASLLLVHVWRRLEAKRRHRFAVALALLATFFPLGFPTLAGTLPWALGFRYPRFMDWHAAREIADQIERTGLRNRLIAVYATSFGSALPVYEPLTVEKGHWKEVQPAPDPADDLTAGVKAYVLPLSPRDQMLMTFEDQGLLRVWGGTGDCSIVTLDRRVEPSTIVPVVAAGIARESRWLSSNAVNNALPGLRSFIWPQGNQIDSLRHSLELQRFAAGRLQLLTLIYAYSLEPSANEPAKNLRKTARGFGLLASRLSDEYCINSINDDRYRILRINLTRLANTAGQMNSLAGVQQELVVFRELFVDFLPPPFAAWSVSS